MPTIRRSLHGFPAFTAGVVLFLSIGCSDAPEVGEVQGRVLLDGQPLKDATLTFQPNGGGRPATGTTDANGDYELTYTRGRKGALLGQHQVAIRTFYPPSGVYNEKGNLVMLPERPERLPKRYHSETELSAEVKSGLNTCNFDLQAK